MIEPAQADAGGVVPVGVVVNDAVNLKQLVERPSVCLSRVRQSVTHALGEGFFERIMEEGVEYLLSEYPKPEHYVNAGRPYPQAAD